MWFWHTYPMAFDLFSKKQTAKNWALSSLILNPAISTLEPTPSATADASRRAAEELRDTKVSFRGKGAVVSRIVRF